MKASLVLRLPALAAVGLPVVAGLTATLLPAFGWWPALGGTSFSLDPWRDLASQPGIGRSILLTAWIGLASTVLSLAATLLLCAGLWGTPAFAWMRRALSPILALPHAAFALGFAFLLAPSGLVARALSPWATGWDRPPDLLIVNDPAGLAMIAGLVVKETPFLLLMALAALPRLDADRCVAVARSLGYGPFSAFLHTVWPGLYRLLRLPVLVVLAYSLSAVDMARILGPIGPAPLAVEAVRLGADPDLSLRFVAAAAALGVVLVAGTALLAWLAGEALCGRVARRAAFAGRRQMGDAGFRGAAVALALLLSASAAAALASLAVWSFATRWTFPSLVPEGFGLSVWTRQEELLPLSGGTAMLALLVAGLSLALAIAFLEGERRSEPGASWFPLLYLPLLLPDIGLLAGLRSALLAAGIEAPLAGVVIAHLVFVLPYVALSLADPWRRLDPRYDAVAASMGYGPVARLLFVRFPVLARPLATALALGFSVSLAQYLSTLLVGGGRVATLATEAVALAGSGDRRVAAAYGLAQAAMPFLGFVSAALIPAFLFRHRRGMQH